MADEFTEDNTDQPLDNGTETREVADAPSSEEETLENIEDEKQEVVNESTPIDGAETELALKEQTLSSAEKEAAWFALELDEYEQNIGHRRKWSNWLLRLIIFITVMDFVIVIAVGFDWVTYKSPYAIPAFITSNLAEVFGLSYIVVQFLFPSSPIKKK